jgi:hypothetical protein
MKHWTAGAAFAVSVSCIGPAVAADEPAAKTSAPPGIVGRVTFTGMCDASAAVMLDERRVIVADDDEDVLRVYDVSRGGAPLASTDLSTWLGAGGTSRGGAVDIEAATKVGNQALWLTSHARKDEGAKDLGQSRFFATVPTSDGTRHEPTGRPYVNLRKHLLKHPELVALGKSLKKGGPEEPVGLNLEGAVSRSDGSLLLGFRNPLIEDRALVIPLLNPEGTLRGESPRLGPGQRLDLGGLAVRDLTRWREQILIVAGPVPDGGVFRLFLWNGASGKPEPIPVDLTDLNPEAALAFDDRGLVLLLSDDGDVRVDGKKCGKAAADRRQFRGVWVQMP